MYVRAEEWTAKVMVVQQDTVLVIGNGIFAAGLAGLLRSRGLRVIRREAQESSHVLASLPSPPVAIVIDLLVASRDDFALLRRLRADRALATVPILVSSPGTIVGQEAAMNLEGRLRAYGARPLLHPHDLDVLLDALIHRPADVA